METPMMARARERRLEALWEMQVGARLKAAQDAAQNAMTYRRRAEASGDQDGAAGTDRVNVFTFHRTQNRAMSAGH